MSPPIAATNYIASYFAIKPLMIMYDKYLKDAVSHMTINLKVNVELNLDFAPYRYTYIGTLLN